MYSITNPHKFQLGGGRILPGLVYNQDPALMNYLSSPKPSGFNEFMQVENLRFQHDNARRANAQLLLQDEQFAFEQEQAKIRNNQIKQQENRLQEQHEYEKAKYGLEVAQKYHDKITGLKYNPKHEQLVKETMFKNGVTDENGNLKLDTSSVEGLNASSKSVFNFLNSGNIRDIMRESIESDLVTKSLEEKTKEIQKMRLDPEKSIYFNTDQLESDLRSITKRLEDYRNNSETQEDLSSIRADLNGLNIDYSSIGNDLMQATVDKAKSDINLSKVKAETDLYDSYTNRMIAEGKLRKMKAEEAYDNGVLDIKRRLANNEISTDQAELAIKQLRDKHGVSSSGDNLTEAERKDEQIKRVMRQYNIDELTAINKIAQAQKGEGAGVSGSVSGHRYTNIPINKDGNIEINNIRLQTGELWKSVSDTPVVENTNYDTYTIGYDSPNREVDYSTDKPEIQIVDTGFGDGYIQTNSPQKLANILSKTKGWNKDPRKWSEEQWDSLDVDKDNKVIKVPLSWIGVQDTSTSYSSLTDYGNDAVPQTTEFTNNSINYLAGGRYQKLQSLENNKEAFRKAFDTYGIKFPAGKTSDGISYQDSFDQMEMDTKGLAITIAPLLNGTNATFTSGKRYSNNTDKGHGEGKGFDIQLGKNPDESIQDWYYSHQNWMDYVKKTLTGTLADPTVGKITSTREDIGDGIKDTYFIHDAKTQGYFSFHILLHPSTGTKTPHIDFKVREVRRGMRKK